MRTTHMSTWPPENKGFYSAFRRWLKATGYGEAAVELYSVAARLTLEMLDRRYWEIDLDRDLATVREHITASYPSKGTRETYLKGVTKFEHYLRQRLNQPAPEREPNWRFYVQGLPDWLAQDVKAFVQHRQRAWPAERVLENRRVKYWANESISFHQIRRHSSGFCVAGISPKSESTRA